MRRIRLTVSYDGTEYHGSQLQPNGITIEARLNEAIRKLGGGSDVIFASRTDAGVHALGNVAVFDTELRMAADKFVFALNQRLPEDIRIRHSDEVELQWHPRKQNCKKSYEYRIYNSRIPNPLQRRYAQFCYYSLDTECMRKALGALIGEHDFAALCSSGSGAEHTVRRIYSAELLEEGSPGDRLITLRICGSGFLYNMVRIIAGTLLQIGMGRLRPEQMAEILRSRDRRQAGPVAAACGLTLKKIEFLPALLPELQAENEDWSYVLDQRRTKESGGSCLTIRRCAERDYEALLTRLLHETHRNGAVYTLLRDLERPERLAAGQRYGYYLLSAHEGVYPVCARDAGEGRKAAKDPEIQAEFYSAGG